VRVMERIPQPDVSRDMERPDPALSTAPHRVYNIGNHDPVQLTEFIGILERALGRTAQKRLLPMQPGDVTSTYADTADLRRDVGFAPDTPLEQGIGAFVKWYREFYGVA